MRRPPLLDLGRGILLSLMLIALVACLAILSR